MTPPRRPLGNGPHRIPESTEERAPRALLAVERAIADAVEPVVTVHEVPARRTLGAGPAEPAPPQD